MTTVALAALDDLQVFRTPALRSIRLMIESFLEVSLGNIALPTDVRAEQITLLNRQDIEACVVERPPFVLLGKAVIIGGSYILSAAPISVARCEGHFPDRPVVPLVRMCEAAAQTGVVLFQHNITTDKIPVAMGSERNRSLISDFTEPPITLLIEGIRIKERKNTFCEVNGKIYADGRPIAYIDEIKYLTAPRSAVTRRTAITN